MTQAEATLNDEKSIVHDALQDLANGSQSLSRLPIDEILKLVLQCRELVASASKEWVRLCCEAKQISATDPVAAEEILGGPVGVLRYLNLIAQSLQEIQSHGTPSLPGRVSQSISGRLDAEILPIPALYDQLIFMGLDAKVRFLEGTTTQQIFSSDIQTMKEPTGDPLIEVVLGAGNVSSIPIVDALCQIFQKRRAVLLKLNPVNAYLEPCFNSAFEPLISANFLKIVTGDAATGEAAILSPQIQAVHITGSSQTYKNIYQTLAPRLEQDDSFQITSELGNVTPWIVIPGQYSRQQLKSQAGQVVSSIVNNASFNCIATKMIVTSKNWPQREEFLNLVEAGLKEVPARYPYYPGAVDRYERFAKTDKIAPDAQSLPWTLIKQVSPQTRPELFQEESFVCVTGETSLEAESAVEFLHQAVAFANQQIEGTLAIALTIPQTFEKRHARELDQAINSLDYGTVSINLFPGVAFGLMAPPWGGSSTATPDEPHSGYGNVHNTYFLDNIDKTIVKGKLSLFPKPVWVPGHRTAQHAAWKLLDLYRSPRLLGLPPLFYQALRG